jgi:hypothetical protein
MAKAKKSGMGQLAQQVNWALKNSRGGMGGMAAMMGIPFQQKTGNQWMTIDPRSQSIYPSGTTPPPANRGGGPLADSDGTGDGDPATGGDEAAVDPAKLGKMGKVGGFPQWYIDWFNAQGKYGGVPQVSGLLNG